MQKQKNSSKRAFNWTLYGIAFLSLLVAFLYFLAQSPDMELNFHRTIPSQSRPERIDRFISSVSRWPQWFYSLDRVKILNSDGSSKIEKGSLLVLEMDPHKGKRMRFQLTAEITQYLPGQKLALKITQDSSGRLTRLFDHLEWNIDIQDKDNGSVINGTVIAHTRHWRSRLIGQLAEKILLNQIFYPNLVKLAELKHPFSMDSEEQTPKIL